MPAEVGFLAALRRWAGSARGRGPEKAADALVYRGPAALPGCPEAVARSLAEVGLRPRFVGPREPVRLSRESLRGCRVYAQPGGPDLDDAWPHLAGGADLLREYVRGGGRYLGFCLGGYLAGKTPGFGLLPGDTDRYISSPGATVRHEGDALVTVTWAGVPRQVFFQDGPVFDVDESGVDVLARYDNGQVAALVCGFGAGTVGVVGPHPEATDDWYDDAGLTPPEPAATDLARDLVATVLAR
ncbi:BPL-N domain-containing protein [Agilicoccus flavus]|uniref:BPL-N domain-containing protein n=1 Tax=Agilicoccus flavus TaxID=2775968 RepID=UPI001CF65DC7|nr:BPL-N domain-containing protein [Agilicoccus flavus]